MGEKARKADHIQVVGYCASCRWFASWASERPVVDGQARFGRCRLGVRVSRQNASCDRYQPRHDVFR